MQQQLQDDLMKLRAQLSSRESELDAAIHDAEAAKAAAAAELLAAASRSEQLLREALDDAAVKSEAAAAAEQGLAAANADNSSLRSEVRTGEAQCHNCFLRMFLLRCRSGCGS